MSNYLTFEGRLFKLIEVNEKAITNEEHFRSDFEQIIKHYKPILDIDEMMYFSSSQLYKHIEDRE